MNVKSGLFGPPRHISQNVDELELILGRDDLVAEEDDPSLRDEECEILDRSRLSQER